MVSDDDLRERLLEILDRLREEYPQEDGTELKHDTPFQLLVATILSAQSTDEIVNEITPSLFEKYSSVEDFVEADREELEKAIFSSGYYRNKAKWIQGASKKLVEEYDSNLPRDIDELVELPGVGRKTANIVLADAFGIEQGIPVDTHVNRLTERLGFSDEKNRDKMERELMDLVPRKSWYEYANLLITHGRKVCEARNPRCENCVIKDLCLAAFTFD